MLFIVARRDAFISFLHGEFWFRHLGPIYLNRRYLTGHVVLRPLPSARITYAAAATATSLPPTTTNQVSYRYSARYVRFVTYECNKKIARLLSRSVVQNVILNIFSRYSLLSAMLTNAVAEMGDRAKAKWAENWGGAADPSPWGSWVPI